MTAALFWQNLLHPTTYAAIIDLAVKFLFGWRCQSMSLVQKAVSYQHLYSFTSVRILVVSPFGLSVTLLLLSLLVVELWR